MSEAGRVQRHWLALAVAMLWTVSVGGQSEAKEDAEKFPEGLDSGARDWLEALADPVTDVPGTGATVPAARGESAASVSAPVPWAWGHTVGVFRRGWTILSQALSGGRLLRVRWHPEFLVKPVLAQAGFS
jgi:hypothetical protein